MPPPAWRVWRPRLIFAALVVTLLLSPGWLKGDWAVTAKALLATVAVACIVVAGILFARPRS